jgi:hypothetical protein
VFKELGKMKLPNLNVVKYFRYLLGNQAQRNREIVINRRTIAISSACLLSLGAGGGVVYKKLHTQTQRQTQINYCYFVPTPTTPRATLTAKPMPKTVTSPKSA